MASLCMGGEKQVKPRKINICPSDFFCTPLHAKRNYRLMYIDYLVLLPSTSPLPCRSFSTDCSAVSCWISEGTTYRGRYLAQGAPGNPRETHGGGVSRESLESLEFNQPRKKQNVHWNSPEFTGIHQKFDGMFTGIPLSPGPWKI